MRSRTTKSATTAAVSAALALSLISPVNADTVPTTQVAKVATQVQAVAGTNGVVPASQTGHDADSAAIARVDGGTVDVPKDPSNDVTITTPTGEQIGIGIANGETARDATTTASGTTVYTDPASATATAVQATTDGVRQLFILNTAKAPTDFTVPLTLPDGARLEKDGSDGYDIVPAANAEGVATSIAHIAAPWAKDASGRSLATSYSLDGTVLTQHISTAGAVYPVVADPRLTYGSHNGFPTVYLNLWGSEVQAVGYALAITVGGTAALGCTASNIPVAIARVVKVLCMVVGGATVRSVFSGLQQIARGVNPGTCYQQRIVPYRTGWVTVNSRNC